MKTWWAILIGVIGGLLGAGLLLLMNSNPRGEAVTLAPPPDMVFHVGDVVGKGLSEDGVAPNCVAALELGQEVEPRKLVRPLGTRGC